MKILAIIPARGCSKGVIKKNIRELLGRPLIAYTIEAAKQSALLDRIIVSTDDAEIAAVSERLMCEVMMRPATLAMDETPTLNVLQHVIRNLKANEDYAPDAVMTLQPTSPLRTSKHIDEAATLFSNTVGADSLVSCINVPHNFHPLSVMKKDKRGFLQPFFDVDAPLRRQDKETVLARNGAAIYITRTKCLKNFVFGGSLLAYMMDEDSSVDLDTLEDFIKAERLLKK
jgi:CMP-N-acetylneuraminic acid synthetase